VVYTGTHDNDTARGWYSGLDRDTARRVAAQLGVDGDGAAVPEALVRAALGSLALLAILPVQDLLGLGSAARLNSPGTAHGNWSWRVPHEALTTELARDYARLNSSVGRG
jgi:4-alpha-glucanotransferase